LIWDFRQPELDSGSQNAMFIALMGF